VPDTQKIEEALQGILGWVQKQKEAAQETQPQCTQPAAQPNQPAQPAPARTPASPWNWVVGLIVAAVVLIGLSILSWYLWSKGKELAKLRHEKDVAEMEKHTAEVQAELTVLEDKREDLQTKALECESKITELSIMIEKTEAERQAAHAKIDTLTSWDDVDRMVKP